VVSWFVDGRLEMRDGAAWLDGVQLPAQGYAAEE
jgi:phosphoribosylglycinamide formyltransferase-1